MSDEIKKFDEFKTNEIFSAIANSVGKAAGWFKGKPKTQFGKWAKGSKDRLKDSVNKKLDINKDNYTDDDLGDDILSRVKKLPTEYKKTTVLNRSFKHADNWYFVIINTSKGSMKIDAIYHKDWKKKGGKEEYTITKQKVEKIREKTNEELVFFYEFILTEASITMPSTLEKPIRLEISSIKKQKIFETLKNKYEETNPKY
jgi:hypothetical protein